MAKKSASTRSSSVIDHAARATQSIAQTVTGRGKGAGGISIHVHVGDLFLIGFDEAIDAEEWGAREVSMDGSGQGRAVRRQLETMEPERKTKRHLSFRKGNVQITADEEAEPADKTAPSKRRKTARTAKTSQKRR